MPCKPTVCGDGIVEGKEPCDDGNHDMGKIDSLFGEQCDDGNKTPGDGCDQNCVMESPK